MLKIISILAMAVLAASCTPITVIQPVATKNQRNADALNQNLSYFLDTNETYFNASLEAVLIDARTDLLKNIQGNDNPGKKNLDEIYKFYNSAADMRRKEIDGLYGEILEEHIRSLQIEYPLSSAVAFDNMPPQKAAAIWGTLSDIHKLGKLRRIKPEAIQRLYFGQIGDLAHIKRLEQTIGDISSAYKSYKEILLAQSANGKLIANQLVDASKATQNASVFLQGITENDEIVTGIGQLVFNKTSSTRRKNAAEQLLAELKSKSK